MTVNAEVVGKFSDRGGDKGPDTIDLTADTDDVET
ncbi:hypothetical protein A2U01_0115930, partial [Trifolium medium]|nr:hypothetical protein [Trifolium medium]